MYELEKSGLIKVTEEMKQEMESNDKIVDSVKNSLKKYFLSEAFVKRLENGKAKLKEDEIKEKQKRLINNLTSVKIIYTSIDEINHFNKSKDEEDFYIGGYSKEDHAIGISLNIPDSVIKNSKYKQQFSYLDRVETITHELIHASYKADEELTIQEKKMLYFSFRSKEMIYKKNIPYFRDIAERIVRKVLLEFELQRLNIKNIGETFTEDHYTKLKDLMQKTKIEILKKGNSDYRIGEQFLLPDCYQLVISSSKEGLIRLMNEL